MKNNLLEQINPNWNCTVSEKTCFQRNLMGNRVMRSYLIAKECERHEVNREIFTWKKL